MILITAVDNSMGLMFNNRRQSQDRIMIEKIYEIIKNNKLYVNQYSSKLFNNDRNIIIDNNFLNTAKDNDYVFAENVKLSDYADKIKKIILFKWNRDYPSDFFLDISLSDYKLEYSEDFQGSSHDRITMEVYNAEN